MAWRLRCSSESSGGSQMSMLMPLAIQLTFVLAGPSSVGGGDEDCAVTAADWPRMAPRAAREQAPPMV